MRRPLGVRLRLAVRITLILLAATVVGMLVVGVYASRVLESWLVANLESGLVKEARLIHDAVLSSVARSDPRQAVQGLAVEYAATLEAQVAVIAEDGTVLGDSEQALAGARRIENYGASPEVRAALAGGVGRHRRRSGTLNAEMLYVAIPLDDGAGVQGVLRLALPTTEAARVVTSIRWIVMAAALLAFSVVLGVGLLLRRRVTRPVTEMRAIARRVAHADFTQRVVVTGRDEIADLGRALNLMASRLREKIQDLEGERAKARAILDGMVEGVIALDHRGRILLMNPGARSIFGLGREPVEGRPLLEVVRQKDLYALVEACEACAPGESCRREIELGPPIGRILQARAARVPFDTEGTGSLLVLHDITDLRRLEQVRTEFVANVSHELRTPLTAIRGYLETALDEIPAEPATLGRFLKIAHTHAMRLGRLVDDLLQLSDIEMGKVTLKLAPVVLHEAAREVAAVFEHRAAEKQLVLLNQVPPTICVQADRDRLSQVLLNLVDNAVKYTPEHGQVALGAAHASDDVVVVWVSDTGIGIPSIDLPRISERFYRVDKARSRELGGTGLGLAIVKHLVQAHGGELGIDSEVGKGTTVRFTLPAAPG